EVEVVIYGQRRMIAELLLLVDGRPPSDCSKAGRAQLVIESPPNILGVGLASVAPPCVALIGGIGVQATVHINPKQLIDYLRQPAALFWQEAAVLQVALPVLEVGFLVRDVPVTANDDLA